MLTWNPATEAADSSTYFDAETGFTFAQFNGLFQIGKGILYRVAVPSPVPANASYDVVFQIVAPIAVGWTGLAWGGGMVRSPLTVTWQNGQTVTIGSRYATGHSMPSVYPNAVYTKFKTGTKVNSTHWQVTAKCSGCSTFIGSTNSQVTLPPKGVNRLAFAESNSKPATPSSSTSTFNVHDVTNSFTADFASAGNTEFAALVAKNGEATN
ncbi:hypothetical protein HYFRA_00013153 [Hymenoscyphus fraxineus]|uniref:Cellobiose dehydrogenase-like cytochrome domain-containing protein n=1 Tax=Hymenoscyphus fraxineus TaxID=746836 RepID=A0A9N9L7D1_9HELO|nr:hypothetical protein HYFRA_00013153 [Hymenoscyphus fraxineus]